MRRGLLVAFAVVVCGGPLEAQSVAPVQAVDAPRSASFEFLPRFDFLFSLEHLFSEEERYVWDGNFGGDIDIVGFGPARATLVANYQTMLGSELQVFDPNQGNYTIEPSVSVRAGPFEGAAVFHHVSRHLSDRTKRQAIDWNMVGGRIRGVGRRGRARLEARADVRGVVQQAFVDYRWEIDAQASARVAVRPRMTLSATGAWRVLGVDGSRGRGTQQGARGEGGVVVTGGSAELALFVAAEQRIDPYQLEFSTVRWLTAGFRISSLGPSRVP